MTTMPLELLKEHKCYDGCVRYYTHASRSTGTALRFAVYVPPQAARGPMPVVYWLSGLTCTEENFITKAGAPAHASRLGLLIVVPDTSPRGAGVPGEDDSYDLGTGAGFYVNATQDPWRRAYRMYDYVVDELPGLIEAHLPVDRDRRSIMGHSMGGHGALVAALRNPGRYRAVSAFAPICAPSQTPWGQKAFAAYLGDDRQTWLQYDAAALVRAATAASARRDKLPLWVEQGSRDESYEGGRLRPDLLEAACREADHPLELRYRDGYDHSYYFVQSFLGEHLARHARALGVKGDLVI
jgi:S-formylglutathione hydrolase